MGQRTELTKERHRAIAKFLDDNAELFAIKEVDDVGDGPYILSDWCLALQMRDLSVDDESGEPNEARAAFFRPGMTHSQKLGLIASLDEGVRFPRVLDEPEDD
jgi:hypothetical protein